MACDSQASFRALVRELRTQLGAVTGERDALLADLRDTLRHGDAVDLYRTLARDPRLTLRWLVHDRTRPTAPPLASFADDDDATAFAAAYDRSRHREVRGQCGGDLDATPRVRAVVTLAPEVPT